MESFQFPHALPDYLNGQLVTDTKKCFPLLLTKISKTAVTHCAYMSTHNHLHKGEKSKEHCYCYTYIIDKLSQLTSIYSFIQ